MPSGEFMPVTGSQFRAARALVGWSAEALAERSGVGLTTVAQAEAHNGTISIAAPDVRAMRQAFEEAGVEFIPENGVGVRFAKRSGPPDEGLRPEQLTTENDI
jgi:transcriptional regulator with XRE-family HTH domain